MKKKAVISLDPEVYDRFKQLSYERHLPMSALVTSWVMSANVTYEHRWSQKTIMDHVDTDDK